MGHERIHPDTQLGHVHYLVRDLDGVAVFYETVLGFARLWARGDSVALGAGQRELLRLTRHRGGRRVKGTTGLYHTAFLVPEQRDLAYLVRSIVQHSVPIQGSADHGTHWAIYLPDPEGNGVELAWDCPQQSWPMRDGMLDFGAMRRGGVDFDALLSTLGSDAPPWSGLPDAARVGHIHLHVSDLTRAHDFYHRLLGFDLTMNARQFGALFVSAGGYHHHIGLNIWRGENIPPPPPEATGLHSFKIELADKSELDRLARRLHQEGIPTENADGGLFCRDPFETGLVIGVGPK